MEGLNEDQGGVEVSNGRAKPCYPVLVCVDGLISSGKSTLLSNLKEKGFITYPEPLSEWKGQLERFYANPKKEFLNTQSFILDSQIKLKEKLVQLFYSPDKAPALLATASKSDISPEIADNLPISHSAVADPFGRIAPADTDLSNDQKYIFIERNHISQLYFIYTGLDLGGLSIEEAKNFLEF